MKALPFDGALNKHQARATHNWEKRVLNGLDLFSGIGGISLALSPWVKPLAYCENDRFAQAVLMSRMRDGGIATAPIWDDITTLVHELLPRAEIDIIYGGFPCQDISVAGHGVGLEGKRSGLFFEMARLVETTCPEFVFLENVPAIRTRGAELVGKTLSGLGYDCRWDVVSAKEVGASFIGARWFLLAAAADSETLRIEQGRSIGEDRKAAALDSPTCDVGLTPWSSERGFEPRVFGARNGIPHSVDRDRGLGNAVVPAQAREAFKRLMGIRHGVFG